MERGLIEEQSYHAYKPLLFAIAYRMLGSVMDAEDIIQEAFIALRKVELEEIDNIKAYLCRIVTNRCIDRLRVLSKQRELYIGPWLPEPLLTEGNMDNDPSQIFMRKESISTAFLLLLQQLTWVERAVFILREVLEYDYEAIADIVGKSSANCRQIYLRAKRSIGQTEKSNISTQLAAALPMIQGVVEQFVLALTTGDVGKLMTLIAKDANLYSDGGGKVTAAIRPILGAERIVSFFMGIMKKLPDDLQVKLCSVNGQTGIVGLVGGKVFCVFTFQMEANQVSNLYLMVNPDKLASFPL